MSPLLAPILAQLVTLNVGDRTEARYLALDDDKHMEASTRPIAALNFGWQHSNLSLGYAPLITISPLEHSPRDTYVFHNGYLIGAYHWRHTTLTLTESVGDGKIGFRVQPVGDPGLNVGAATPVGPVTPTPAPGATTTGPNTPGAPATGTNTPPTNSPQGADQRLIKNQIVRYFTWSTTAAVTHQLSRDAAVGADANYTEGGGKGEFRTEYPFLRGVRVNAYASYTQTLSRRDAFTTVANAQFATSSTGDRAYVVQGTETWVHHLSALTLTRLGAGLAITRWSLNDGTVAYSIYPTFLAGITHFDRLAGGLATVSMLAMASPYLDPLRGTIDPRLTLASSATWTKRRFSTGATAGAAISLGPDSGQGAVNSVGGTVTAKYQIANPVSVDCGLAYGWQTFAGSTIIPASWTAFVGLSFAAALPLNGTPR